MRIHQMRFEFVVGREIGGTVLTGMRATTVGMKMDLEGFLGGKR